MEILENLKEVIIDVIAMIVTLAIDIWKTAKSIFAFGKKHFIMTFLAFIIVGELMQPLTNLQYLIMLIVLVAIALA